MIGGVRCFLCIESSRFLLFFSLKASVLWCVWTTLFDWLRVEGNLKVVYWRPILHLTRDGGGMDSAAAASKAAVHRIGWCKCETKKPTHLSLKVIIVGWCRSQCSTEFVVHWNNETVDDGTVVLSSEVNPNHMTLTLIWEWTTLFDWLWVEGNLKVVCWRQILLLTRDAGRMDSLAANVAAVHRCCKWETKKPKHLLT